MLAGEMCFRSEFTWDRHSVLPRLDSQYSSHLRIDCGRKLSQVVDEDTSMVHVPRTVRLR